MPKAKSCPVDVQAPLRVAKQDVALFHRLNASKDTFRMTKG